MGSFSLSRGSAENADFWLSGMWGSAAVGAPTAHHSVVEKYLYRISLAFCSTGTRASSQPGLPSSRSSTLKCRRSMPVTWQRRYLGRTSAAMRVIPALSAPCCSGERSLLRMLAMTAV